MFDIVFVGCYFCFLLFFVFFSVFYFFFFFSSRRRHTRSKRDWSSDVCSSDLLKPSVAYRRLASDIVELVLDPRTLPGRRLTAATSGPLLQHSVHRVGGQMVEIGRASCRERV